MLETRPKPGAFMTKGKTRAFMVVVAMKEERPVKLTSGKESKPVKHVNVSR